MNAKKIRAAWETVGIKMTPKGYCIGGLVISQKEDMAHAQQVVGKTLKESDWKW
ncbi:MAG: hypothetical protein II921_05750 [Treponema sp.]|nr:hypothetical protein [Treponema sp.]